MSGPIIVLTSTVNINNNKCCIVQVNSKDRLEAYLKSVRQWLEKTNLKIILVENSGYTFPELKEERNKYKDRFEIISFNELDVPDADYLKQNNSKGASEIFEIVYAAKHSKIIQTSTFLIKVTARFFIPGLEDYLKAHNLNEYDCLTQNNPDRCEMIGCHHRNLSRVFDLTVKRLDGWIEYEYKDRVSSLEKKLVCQPFPIEKTARGGAPEFYTEI